MDERLTTLTWILVSGGGGGLLGALFGGLAGAVHWKNGNATGTGLGLGVARAFDRIAQREMKPGVKGAIVGGVDGLAFLGVVGIIVGAVVMYGGGQGKTVLLPMLLGLALLMGGAVLFGMLAWGILRAGVRSVASVFACGITGALLGAMTAGASGLLAGCVGGAVVGNVLALLFQRWSAAPEPPEAQPDTRIRKSDSEP
jgi:hypothetical protein